MGREKKNRKIKSAGYGVRCLAVCAVLALSVQFLGGCSNGDVRILLTTGLSQGELFRIEDKGCMESEARLFMLSQKNRYESAYGEEIWYVSVGDGMNFADYMDEQLQNFLTQLTCMVLMAEDREISLTGDDEQLAAAAAREYYAEMSNEEQEYIGLDRDEIEEIFEDYRLAEMLVEEITEEVSREFSDDEARVIEVQQIVWNKTTKNSNGEITQLSDDAVASLVRTAQEARTRAVEGESFTSLQELYSDEAAGSIKVQRSEMDETWEQAAFSLGIDEISDVVETDTAVYVIYCVSNLLEQETEEHKSAMLEEIQAAEFYSQYNSFISDLAAIEADDAWDNLSFADPDMPEGSADFYKVYEDYFG